MNTENIMLCEIYIKPDMEGHILDNKDHLYEMAKTGKFIVAESRLVVSQGWQMEKRRRVTANDEMF